jgi:hypothetical protein
MKPRPTLLLWLALAAILGLSAPTAQGEELVFRHALDGSNFVDAGTIDLVSDLKAGDMAIWLDWNGCSACGTVQSLP